ncbi:MAG: TolC family protein [Gemmatirosa sp.]
MRSIARVGRRVAAGGVAALCTALVAVPARVHAQAVPGDSRPDREASAAFTLDAFARRVAAHHPVVRQARLGVDHAREEQRVARGAFDPTVSAAWDRKTFGTVAYYDYATAALTVPTPVGVDVKLGYERTAGRYAGPDRRTPAGGLFTLGVALPLGQRMLTDERRTALVVARALRDGAEADRDAVVNRTLLQASRDYARWYEAERRVAISREGVALADFRLGAVRRRVAAGEAAALDTTEALLEAHRREVQLVEAAQAAYSARLTVEAHLWDARGLPDSLPANAAPSAAVRALAAEPALVAQWAAAAARAHPDVARAGARLEQAAAQRRLAVQQQLPYAALELGALGDAGGGIPAAGASADDLKVGAVVRAPLLYLRERGRANAASLRVEQQRVERERVRRDVAVGVRIAAGEVGAVSRAADAQRAATAQARLLLRGEQRRFEAGESTLFLVNVRERALLDEELRLAALEARGLVARAELEAMLGAPIERGRD